MSDRVGRMMRKLAGVDEEVLDQVPHERPRFTAMSGVLLGSALLSVLSAATAVNLMSSLTWWGGLLVALWGAVTLVLDRWVIISVATQGVWPRVRSLLPRVLLSVVFGVLIAEPLVLSVFKPAIDARIESQGGTVGLLARMQAFDELQKTDSYAHMSAWALRVFFIAVTMLPALVTIVGGSPAYGRVLAALARGRTAARTRSRALVTERVASLPPVEPS